MIDVPGDLSWQELPIVEICQAVVTLDPGGQANITDYTNVVIHRVATSREAWATRT